ncbi:MAG: FAD-dependent oxidoreductase [Oscillospiraceae bacterium]|nr:FAD-dependent oxidoreductase [Oscillospiraceae bacterium]
MASLKKINKILHKKFGEQVAAREEGGRLVLSGELESWRDVVLAGKIAAHENPYFYFVNEILCTGEKPMPIRKPRIEDGKLEWEEPDVLIIGGGIIGCAIARELSRYKLNILLVEKEHDLAMHASGRNNGIINSGVPHINSTLKTRFAKLGNDMFDKTCSDLGVTFERCGQLFYFQNRMWEPFTFLSLWRRKWWGHKNVAIIPKETLHKSETALNKSIGSALFYPKAGIVDPFDLTLAFAENAASNGVVFSFNTMVQGMVVENGEIQKVQTNRGAIMPKVVINAAGAFGEDIATYADDRFFSLHPNKKTNVVVDKKYVDSLVETPTFPIVKKRNKKKRHLHGTGITRTIGGSFLIGPDVFGTINREDFSTLLPNVQDIIGAQTKTCPKLEEKQIISYFSGITSGTYEDDFVVTKGKSVLNIVHAAGITAPGLTAAPAIAVEIAGMAVEVLGRSIKVELNSEFEPKRTPPPKLSEMSIEERSDFIIANPDYGIILCKCEQISRGEVLEALRRNIKCSTLDGVKRRVRTTMGICQGGSCEAQVLKLIASEKRFALHHIKKGESGSELLLGAVKTTITEDDIKAFKSGAPAVSGEMQLPFAAPNPETEGKLRVISSIDVGAMANIIRREMADDGDV